MSGIDWGLVFFSFLVGLGMAYAARIVKQAMQEPEPTRFWDFIVIGGFVTTALGSSVCLIIGFFNLTRQPFPSVLDVSQGWIILASAVILWVVIDTDLSKLKLYASTFGARPR